MKQSEIKNKITNALILKIKTLSPVLIATLIIILIVNNFLKLSISTIMSFKNSSIEKIEFIMVLFIGIIIAICFFAIISETVIPIFKNFIKTIHYLYILKKEKCTIIKCIMKKFYIESNQKSNTEYMLKTKIELFDKNTTINSEIKEKLNKEYIIITNNPINTYEQILCGRKTTECYLIISNNNYFLIHTEI